MPVAQRARLQATIYRFTGWQGLFKIPESWCRECDLLIRATERVAAECDATIEVEIRPWFLWFWKPLFRFGAWKAPILVVNGEMISQGIVPDDGKIANAFCRAQPD